MEEDIRLVRWILILPGAVLVGMIGSLGGGIVATPFGQSAMNTSSAFFGTFAFVCAAGLIAPSHRNKVTIVAASFVSLLALLGFALSVFTTVEEFAGLPAGEKALIPVAQLLGSLYAIFILPPLLTHSNKLERLWRQITGLGIVVGMFGAVVVLVGLVLGLLGRGWVGLSVGIGVLFFGVLTWLYPFAHLSLRVNRAKALMKQQDEELANRKGVQVARGVAVKGITPEIGREISWADVVSEVFRILEFDRSDTMIDQNDHVTAQSTIEPYGYLIVESPIRNYRVKLPIVHRDDFVLASTVFDDPKLADAVAEVDLLVTYVPERLLRHGLAGSTSHVLHYVMTPRGTLDRYYAAEDEIQRTKPELEKLFGKFVYVGEIRVQMNPDPML